MHEHETTSTHILNMEKWNDLHKGIMNKATIDEKNVEQMLAEKEYWRNVLRRLIDITIFLAERNLAFRGSTETLGQQRSGNFVGMVELLAKYDPILMEHTRRIAKNRYLTII